MKIIIIWQEPTFYARTHAAHAYTRVLLYLYLYASITISYTGTCVQSIGTAPFKYRQSYPSWRQRGNQTLREVGRTWEAPSGGVGWHSPALLAWAWWTRVSISREKRSSPRIWHMALAAYFRFPFQTGIEIRPLSSARRLLSTIYFCRRYRNRNIIIVGVMSRCHIIILRSWYGLERIVERRL